MTTWLANNLDPAAPPRPSLTGAVAEAEEACRAERVALKAVSASPSAVTLSIDEGTLVGERLCQRLAVPVWRVQQTPTLTSVAGKRPDGLRVIVYTAAKP